ncbi:tumor protein p53-inducible protein 11-like [Folsomia candida]|uniref:tumor protein p53-inducible protein 11-like n=1 Tax=Folsomia candida TaxID=158441 RepID=UPI001604E9AD|nr:tumor protein p53-inducible protein 11-like [Folsomia candida]
MERMEEEKVETVDDAQSVGSECSGGGNVGEMAKFTQQVMADVVATITAPVEEVVGVVVPPPAGDEGSAPSTLSQDRPSLPSHFKSDKSPLGRIPKLERKHSSGDLHSRLKTRKMLGVGETDNGDIHRSKISQVLGHNEHLYLKLPKGYWNWQGFLASLLAFQAGFIILLPESSAQLGLIGVQTPTHYVPSQYYAVTMLALSYLIWKFLNIKDKMVTRATLVAILLHFSSLCAVDLLHAIRSGQWSTLVDVKGLTMMGLRGLTLIVSFTYLYRMGTATSGLRKSPSYKDVSSDHNNTANQNRRE